MVSDKIQYQEMRQESSEFESFFQLDMKTNYQWY